MNSRSKKQSKPLDEPHWECSVCTFRNAPEAFKCSMCDVRKGTSTRKPKVNVQLTTPQYSASSTKSARRDDDHSKDKFDAPARKKKRLKKLWKPSRLKNIDRTSAQAREITINNLTIRITEYKAKDKRPTVDHYEHSSASEMSNQSESGFDSSIASHSSRTSHTYL